MRVLPPRTLTFRSHWLPTSMIALLLAAGGLGLLMMPRSAGEMAVGSLLMTLSVAVLADRRSLSIDGSERRVRYRHGLLSLILPARNWAFDDFNLVTVRGGGGSGVGGPQRIYYVHLEGAGNSVRVPLRCTTDTDARIVAGEIAELMRVRFCAEPKDPAV